VSICRKCFSFTPDFMYHIDADEIIKGGTGYAIITKKGKEYYKAELDISLPEEIEHMYPDYSLYGITDTAYGFTSRGCPRNCGFCHVSQKEGLKSCKVADIGEFYDNQKNIVILDPNILACKEWEATLTSLAETKAKIDINQGLDIRLIKEPQAKAILKLKMSEYHFAWDNIADEKKIVPAFKFFKEYSGINERKLIVYVLCYYNSTVEEDIYRVEKLRELGYWAYVMLYDKEHIPKGHVLHDLQRYVNNRFVFAKCKSFAEYKKGL